MKIRLSERRWIAPVVAAALFMCGSGIAQAQNTKPNILVIWGDDIGGMPQSLLNADGGSWPSSTPPASCCPS